MQTEVKDGYWKLSGTEDLKTKPGPRLVELVDARIADGRAICRRLPSAMKCLLADREGLTAYLRFPAERHHRIRHSNFIERTFGETVAAPRSSAGCRRDQLPDPGLGRPRQGLRGWRGLTMTADGLRLLQDLRRSLLDPPRQLRPRTATASQA